MGDDTLGFHVLYTGADFAFGEVAHTLSQILVSLGCEVASHDKPFSASPRVRWNGGLSVGQWSPVPQAADMNMVHKSTHHSQDHLLSLAETLRVAF
jgi:hypothetical protein